MTPAAALEVMSIGNGPRVVLVHGNSEPADTWQAQIDLSASWKLVIPARRGFGRSQATRRQDFERDAEDIVELLGESAHLVGFSYGALGSLLAATAVADRVRSLTVIEPPLFSVASDDPSAYALEHAVEDFVEGRAGARERLREAFVAFGEPPAQAGTSFAEQMERVIRLVKGARSPSEARVDLEAIAAAPYPVLVVSGGHSAAIETICDRLAEATRAERAVVPGAQHFVQFAQSFNARLSGFLSAAEAALGREAVNR
jgi:pimeloyl-ACP methyl ester carboxylesterase